MMKAATPRSRRARKVRYEANWNSASSVWKYWDAKGDNSILIDFDDSFKSSNIYLVFSKVSKTQYYD